VIDSNLAIVSVSILFEAVPADAEAADDFPFRFNLDLVEFERFEIDVEGDICLISSFELVSSESSIMFFDLPRVDRTEAEYTDEDFAGDEEDDEEVLRVWLRRMPLLFDDIEVKRNKEV
jgi:hypothetical protein